MRYDLKDLVGEKVISIKGSVGDSVFEIQTVNFSLELYHSQHCCESVYIVDICGNPSDLIDGFLTMSEEVSSGGLSSTEEKRIEEGTTSFTWTFYKFATQKTYVTVSFFGESNGYYSESVYVYINKKEKQKE